MDKQRKSQNASEEAAGEDQREETEDRSDDEMPRLPDTALRQIFSYLDFSDIKSCRLVSSQWRRFALDNVSFVLAIQHLLPERRSERTAVSTSTDAEDVNRHRNRMALIPFPRTTNEKVIELAMMRAAQTTKPAKQFYFRQMAAILGVFGPKIKAIVVEDVKPILLPVLDTLRQIAPATETIWTIDSASGGVNLVLHKDRRAASFECETLSVFVDDVADLANSVIFQLFSNGADSIKQLRAESFWCLQQMLGEFEKRNVNEPLVFGKCTELSITRESHQLTVAPFRNYVQHLPNLQKLNCAIGPNDPADEIESLEQLANLKSLAIKTKELEDQVLPKLRLPNLNELNLGDNIVLPEEPRDIELTGLKKLRLHADFSENPLRLARYFIHHFDHHRRRCFDNLVQLELTNMELMNTDVELMNLHAEFIKTNLALMFAMAHKLQKIETTQFLPVSQVPIISKIYDLVEDPRTSRDLTAIIIGTFSIPDEAFDCRSLVQQLVGDAKQRNLRATSTIVFNDNATGAMVSALAEAGVGGDDVAVSESVDEAKCCRCKSFDLTWHNNAAGSQQKLKIRVRPTGLEQINA